MQVDYRAYSTFARQRLIDSYMIVSSEIAKTNLELSDAMQDELRGRANAFRTSQESSVSAREKDATLETLHLTTEVIKLRGEIIVLKEEKEILIFLLSIEESSNG